ncbi:DUF1440 domain-containing protein [Pedobacter ginsengisoli]|uniref:DUF1440 domain-containing protein n=1 Tax=Pedobacter ginsengisoli TaxID=363852 RepID=UPI00254BA6A2|nr:DUF1440 domain-containing protein [Pedobacter ginsengisoli]
MRNPHALSIVKAGLLAGLLDILAAFATFYLKTGKNPVIILKFIASGVFGNAAFSGGTEMTILGLLFHFMIALLFAAIFFLLVARILPETPVKLSAGILYGLFVWLVMNLIVVPLSGTPKQSFHLPDAILNAAILIICVGLPISYSYYHSIRASK